jgi:hypothetical protein
MPDVWPFWEWAQITTIARAEAEGWTSDDLHVALLQGSLLTYESNLDNVGIHGNHYLPTCPQTYLHNAPWNDWNPPSMSWARFHGAQARQQEKQDPVRQRVRARVCIPAGRRGIKASKVVFATVEVDMEGARCVCLRRGADVCALMKIEMLQITEIGERFFRLATKSEPVQVAEVFLRFENDARASKFRGMLAE